MNKSTSNRIVVLGVLAFLMVASGCKKKETAPPPPPPAKVVVPPPPPPINVEVIHGSRKTEQKFQSEEKDKNSEAK